MTTKNKRYTVTVNDDISNFLNYSAKKNKKSISNIIHDLINESLSIREDMYWSREANEAEIRAAGKPLIPCEEVWKQLDLL